MAAGKLNVNARNVEKKFQCLFGLSDDMNAGVVLRLTGPRSNRNAVAAFSPALDRSDYAG